MSLAPRWRALAGTAVLLLASLVAYWPALQGGFLWDDEYFVTAPGWRSLSGLSRIWWGYAHGTTVHYPLVHTLFWVEYQLWGTHQVGYHLTTLLLHVTAACLLWANIRQLRIPGAYLAAALFALHPVQVESVAWISEHKNTLSAVFYFSAMLAYLRFDETRKRSLYVLALALFLLALWSKTVTATLPPALLVIMWWKRGGLSWRRDVLPLVPFFVVGAAAGSLTAWVERTYVGAEGEPYELTAVQRGLLAGRAVWFYLSIIVWPAQLMFFYPRWHIDPAVWWQWLFPLTVLAALGALWLIRRRWRAPLACALFFVGTLFPALGFFNVYPFRYSFVADHFQYLANLGVFVPVAAGLVWIGARLPRRFRLLGPALCGALLGTLAGLTRQESHVYHDIETLWRTTIKRNPTCWMAYNNLGTVLQTSGRLPEAITQYEQALRIKPDHGPAHNNLAAALLTQGRAQDAIEHFQKALALMGPDAQVYNNLGAALLQTGHPREAIERYQQALKVEPGYARAQLNMAIAYAGLDHSAEAVAAVTKGLEVARSQGNAQAAQYFESWLNAYGTGQP